MMLPTNPSRALGWVQMLAAAGAVLTSAELLFLRGQFAEAEILGWPQMGRLVDRRRFPWAGLWMNRAMRSRGFMALAALRLGAALLLLWPGPAVTGAAQLGLLAAVLISSLLCIQRLPYGMEGSDQLAAITFAGLLLARLFAHSDRVAVAVLWFLAMQAALAYLVAGVVKVREPGWRDGSLLQAVLATEFYGHPAFAGLLHRRLCARAAIWGVIVFELSFPLVFFLPPPGVLAMLAAGFLFHAVLAAAMGLNAFVWAFLAAYPAIYCCASMVRL
jgi:hypothetical protein